MPVVGKTDGSCGSDPAGGAGDDRGASRGGAYVCLQGMLNFIDVELH